MAVFSSKFTITSLIVCFAIVCVASGTPRSAKDAGQHGSAKANQRSSLNIFERTTKAPSTTMATITAASEAAKKSVDATAAILTGLITTAKSVQSKTSSEAQGQIDGIIARTNGVANRLGGEPGCAVRFMGDSNALGLQIMLDEVECPGNKMAQLEDMALTTVNLGQNVLTIVPDAVIAIDHCQRKGGAFQKVCEAKLAVDFTSRAASISVRSPLLATEAATVAATIEPSLAACAATKVAQASAKAARLVGKNGACTAGVAAHAVGAVGGQRRQHKKQ